MLWLYRLLIDRPAPPTTSSTPPDDWLHFLLGAGMKSLGVFLGERPRGTALTRHGVVSSWAAARPDPPSRTTAIRFRAALQGTAHHLVVPHRLQVDDAAVETSAPRWSHRLDEVLPGRPVHVVPGNQYDDAPATALLPGPAFGRGTDTTATSSPGHHQEARRSMSS